MYDILRLLKDKESEALESELSDRKKNAISLAVELVDTGFLCLASCGLGTLIGYIWKAITKNK